MKKRVYTLKHTSDDNIVMQKRELELDFGSMYEELHCDALQIVELQFKDKSILVICDEEGKINARNNNYKPSFARVDEMTGKIFDVFTGDLIFCGREIDENGEVDLGSFPDMTEKEEAEWQKYAVKMMDMAIGL